MSSAKVSWIVGSSGCGNDAATPAAAVVVWGLDGSGCITKPRSISVRGGFQMLLMQRIPASVDANDKRKHQVQQS